MNQKPDAKPFTSEDIERIHNKLCQTDEIKCPDWVRETIRKSVLDEIREEREKTSAAKNENPHSNADSHYVSNMERYEKQQFKRNLEAYFRDYGCPLKSCCSKCANNHE